MFLQNNVVSLYFVYESYEMKYEVNIKFRFFVFLGHN